MMPRRCAFALGASLLLACRSDSQPTRPDL
jgi:hypothetical protein